MVSANDCLAINSLFATGFVLVFSLIQDGQGQQEISILLSESSLSTFTFFAHLVDNEVSVAPDEVR